MNSLLSAMRITLHVLFATLLLIAIATAWPMSWWLVAVSAVLAAVYVAGTVVHHRGKQISTLAKMLWLAVVLACWVTLALSAREFVWLLFPLVFVICYLILWPYSLLVVAAAWGVAAYASGTALGPLIGTAAAVVGYRIYVALHREVEVQTMTVTQLRDTRDELATTAQRAGRLAEREHLAREIHDTLAQGFSFILLSQAAQQSDDPRVQLQEIEKAARDNLDNARKFLQEPSAGLESPAEAIEHIVSTQRTRLAAMGKSTTVITSLDDVLLPAALSTTVTRVAQEALNNAIKHADASKVVITLQVWNDRLHLDVVDDGRGFDPDKASGFGLVGISNRLKEVKGQLHVESSTVRGGTTLSAQIPL